MRTISYDQGEPKMVEVDDPTSYRPTDLLVSIRASSVNGSDLALARASGLAGFMMRMSRPGFDVAGVVVACGAEVTAFDVGDRVMALLGHGGGGQAELVTVPQTRAALVPDALSDVDAAAIPLAGLTALQALRGRGRLAAGTGPAQSVLVNGAAGGIGSFAIQLAKLHGAQVTAITSSDRFDHVTKLGADATHDRNDTGGVPDGERFDLILDVPGVLRLKDTRRHLTPTGILVSTRPINADIRHGIGVRPQQRRRRRFAVVTTSASSQDLAYLARLAEQRRLTVPVDRVFAFADAADAYTHAGSGKVRGKVVMTP